MNHTDGSVTDPFATARAVADAVLYEGYVLYPYRASACKNQMRWQFGVLVPRGFAESDSPERHSMRTECIVDPEVTPTLAVRVRCLQVQHRSIEAVNDEGYFVAVDRLEVDGKVLVSWDEAVEHVVDLAPAPLHSLPLQDGPAALCWPRIQSFRFPSGEEIEVVRSASGIIAGASVRRRESITGAVRVTASRVEESGVLLKVTVEVENNDQWSQPGASRDDAIGHSLVAVHTAGHRRRRIHLVVRPAGACGVSRGRVCQRGNVPRVDRQEPGDALFADHPLRPSRSGPREPR